MGNLQGFDATTVEPATEFEALPKGDYIAMVSDSEFKPTKSGTGRYLQLSLEILDESHKGRILFDRLNLENSNATAVKIANATLSAICHSLNILQPKDSSEFHGKPMLVSVGVEERNDKPGSFSNVVKGYKAANGSASKPATMANAATPAGTKPPWKK